MTAVNKDELLPCKLEIAETLLPLIGYTVTTKDEVLAVINTSEVIKEVNAFITTQLTSLIERVETAIPDQKIGTKGIPLNHSELGYNIAIQDVCQALATIKQELIEGSK